MLQLWWLWLPLGIALVVYAVLSGSDLATRGGPFIIGCLLVVWGLVGAFAAYRR